LTNKQAKLQNVSILTEVKSDALKLVFTTFLLYILTRWNLWVRKIERPNISLCSSYYAKYV